MVVVHEVRVVLIGLAAEESVIPLKATTKWPAPATCTHLVFVWRCEVPFADRKCGVSIAYENFGDHSVFVRHLRVVSGKSRNAIGDTPHANGVVITAG